MTLEPGRLERLGWDAFFREGFDSMALSGIVPARVVSQERDSWLAITEQGELPCSLPGRARAELESFPVVGDWVAVERLPDEAKGMIAALLPRKSAISRQASGGRQRLSGGKTEEQVLAANVDVIFIVGGLDGGRNVNLRRMERYLALAWNSGATPVVLLNKADLCEDVDSFRYDVAAVAPGVLVHAVSATENTGLEPVRAALSGNVTGVFVGQSGAGKSALINTLLGYERQQTGAIRASDREGRHTTTRRELIVLPDGGLVIDTPGIRELQLWSGEEGLDAVFRDIDELAQLCRFKDCSHEEEPGCAVLAAVERGELDLDRLDNYRKLRRELQHQAARTDTGARLQEKARERQFGRMLKNFKKGNFKER